ncbi:MAG TPA: hypothetical protein PLL32_04130 [Anaeromyxobacteraceae bacterium]|nr:hypothetical protein [Anaeromyxobacteraceae bacterium]
MRSGAGRVLVVAALLWAAILGSVAVVVHRGDLRGFFVTGALYGPPPGQPGWPVREGPGYDGQFFATLSRDPLLLDPATHARLDDAAYRAGPIGLPLAAWVIAAGSPRAAPIVYLFLAWGLGLLGVWVAARWLEDRRRSPWQAFPLALSGGLVAASLRGTPDAAAASLVLLGLWLEWRGGRGASPVLAAASLVRETSLLGAAGVAIARFRDGRRSAALAALLLPGLAVVAWRSWVHVAVGAPTHMRLLASTPVLWLRDKLAPPFTVQSVAEAAAILAVALAVAAGVALLPAWRRWTAAEWTYAGSCALAIGIGGIVYEDRWAASRVHALLPMLAAVLPAGEAGPRARWLLRLVPWACAGAGVLSLALSTRLAELLSRALAR